MLAVRGPARVDHAGLGHQAEGPFGVAAGRHLGLAGGHFFELAAHVHRHGLPAGRRLPGHGTAEGPVDLADARAVAEAPERRAVGGTEAVLGQVGQVAGGDVEEYGLGRGQVGQALHPPARLHLRPEGAELFHQGSR